MHVSGSCLCVVLVLFMCFSLPTDRYFHQLSRGLSTKYVRHVYVPPVFSTVYGTDEIAPPPPQPPLFPPHPPPNVI